MFTDLVLKQILNLATEAHNTQTRKDGSPFINHPIAVAQNLYHFGFKDIELLSAALLHDVLEDTDYTLDSLMFKLTKIVDSTFATVVCGYVINMTNPYSKDNYPTLNRKARKDLEIKDFKSWINPNLKALKLSDILSNLREFDALNIDFAKTYIMEDFEIIKILKIESVIWDTTVEEITKQFKNLILRT